MPELTPSRRAVCLALGLLVAAPAATADDWPHRRGATRDGLSTEASGWDGESWAIGEPLWSGEFGRGASSPIVADGRVYVMGWRDGRDHLFCLDAATGEQLWSASYASPEYGRFSAGDKGLYSGVSAAPEYDPRTGLLFTLGIDGDLNCWDTHQQGRRVWGLNLYDRFGAGQRPKVGRSGLRDYGYTSSPLVQRRWVVVEAGSPQGNLIALHKRSGKPAWFSENTDPAGHTAGPVPLSVDGLPCVAVLTHRGLLVARLDRGHAGATLAEVLWETSFANNVVQPTVHGDHVLLTSAYNHNSMRLLRIARDGAHPVWEQNRASKVCSPVVYDGHVCWAWQKLRCLDFATGEQRWEGGSFGDAGSIVVAADGRLIVWGKQGKLALVESVARSPQAYSELAVRDDLLPAEAWPHAVLAGGRLYLKDRDGNLKCFALDDPGDAGGPAVSVGR